MSQQQSDFRAELEQLAEKLRDPFRMRMAVACFSAAVLVFGVGDQFESKIKRSKADTRRLKSTIHTAEEIELMRASLERVDPLILQGKGTDATLKHLIVRFRNTPASLMRIEPDAPVKVGPFESVRVTAEFAGEFADFHQLLSGLDNDSKLLRVESVAIDAPKQADKPATMQLVVRMMQESV